MIRQDWIRMEYKEVVDKISTLKYKVKQREYLSQGRYPVVDQGQPLVGGYTNDRQKLITTDLPLIVFGDHTKTVKLIEFNFAPGADGTKILRSKKFISPKYLAYLTQVLVLKIKDKGYSRHYQYIEALYIPIAPLVEQRAIVAKIERLFSELDSGTANLKAAKEKLDIYRQSVLKKAFDGKLLSKKELEICRKEKDYEPAKDLLKKINPKAAPSRSEVRDDWAEARLEMACEICNDRRRPINAKERNRRIKGKAELYPYYGATGQVGFIDGYLTDGEYVLVGEDGAPFYDFSRNTAYMIDGKAWVNNHAHVLRSHFSNKFLLHYFNQFDFHGYVSGTTRLKLTQKSLRGIPTKIASVPEQRAIVSAIESRFAVCDKLARSIDEALEKSQAMRQSVLKKAFAGELLSEAELRECRRQPDWEPAEKLLQRIRESKTPEPANRKK